MLKLTDSSFHDLFLKCFVPTQLSILYQWKSKVAAPVGPSLPHFCIVFVDLVWFGFMVFNITFNNISVIYVTIVFSKTTKIKSKSYILSTNCTKINNKKFYCELDTSVTIIRYGNVLIFIFLV